MGQYSAPLGDMSFVLHELLQVEKAYAELHPEGGFNQELIDQVLGQAAKFASEVLFPLNRTGDQHGCRLEGGKVITPPGFKEAYERFCEAGWPSIASDPEYGGQGVPHGVGYALEEMVNSANHAWAMYPTLTHGAYGALYVHGTDEQKKLYLPRLISGRWTGTMCLTEPQAGSDLGLVRTRAEPKGDSYEITGTKIFVSSGEHDMSENIIHLVLARLPDAPAGSKGISLFIVPKLIPNADGEPGARNGIECTALEHKLGIHGNATCVMNLERAQGFLVGEPHKGLQAMFVMMNAARLGVGMQGLGLTEVAYQNALGYAKERLQSRSLSGPKEPSKPADPILVHADVRRMLLTQKAYVEGGRALAYWVALMFDTAVSHRDAAKRKDADDLVQLFTPVVKAFLTDNSVLCTNLALQVCGGHGYIHETGMDQYVRDARITTIYEGTNTIQSLDLLGRKVLLDGGAKLRKFDALVKAFSAEAQGTAGMAEFLEPLAATGKTLERLTLEVGGRAMQDRDEVGAASVDYLRVLGHYGFAYFWARMAHIALSHGASRDGLYAAKLATARFYFQRLLPEVESAARSASSGSRNLFELDAEHF
ncbi:MAG TPA: acyl-CoA dehydrogenase C-terminal domain-containing protein [Polyangiaceae bacterium]|nr:acyl-CoA dehydrogenase C-terminal domain-containing protein [Polyangiaceae bacterium]